MFIPLQKVKMPAYNSYMITKYNNRLGLVDGFYKDVGETYAWTPYPEEVFESIGKLPAELTGGSLCSKYQEDFYR